MKNTIIYSAVFITAFIFVTLGIYLFTTLFNNFFRFDFSPPQEQMVTETNEIFDLDPSLIEANAVLRNELLTEIISALNERENNQIVLVTEEFKNQITQLEESFSEQLNEKSEQLAEINETIQMRETDIVSEKETKDDETYSNWLKSTVKMYEAMDSKKAAKIIQKYSDNVAKDILYAMNRKKAAQIMSELNPETVIKLTKIK